MTVAGAQFQQMLARQITKLTNLGIAAYCELRQWRRVSDENFVELFNG